MAELIKIASRSNQHVVRARRARDGKGSDEIFLEGLRLVEEALRSDVRILFGIAADGFGTAPRQKSLLEDILRRGVDILQVPESVFRSLSDTVNSQGIALLAERPRAGRHLFDQPQNRAVAGLFVYLDKVGDPTNLGAVLRTAEAAGANGVILSTGSADAFSPRALRASMGSSLRLPLWGKCKFAECINWAREEGLKIVAADPSGKKAYTEIDWSMPTLSIFGNEGHGLGDETLECADEIITVPMMNGVESLNLAVAVGVVLFESLRQRTSRV
ncbi:MAG TPA: RNA methyltransferase [Pyrinomonadaceae bacterium]|nr:RNA methyltransferase [Pyrinomonadaceae bacterium]